MEAKEIIEQAKNRVIDQAYVKGCPNSSREWFISAEKLIPLQEMAIFKAGIKEVVELIGEDAFEHNYSMSEHQVDDCFACRWEAQLKDWEL